MKRMLRDRDSRGPRARRGASTRLSVRLGIGLGFVAIGAVVSLPFVVPAQAISFSDWDPLTSKTATNLDEDFESKVTLSLPAESVRRPIDLVFVLDGSTSTDQDELTAQAADLLDELTRIENLQVKSGVIVFGGSVPILGQTQLLSLDAPANVDTLKAAITDQSYDGMPGRSGSNLDAGVQVASAMLAADGEVAANDKFMVILSDGGARMWYVGEEANSQTYELGGAVYWNSIEDYLARYVTGSLTPRAFADVWMDGQSGVTIGAYAMTEAQKNAATPTSPGVAPSATVRTGPGYYPTFEAATYYAGASIEAAVASSTNVIMVTYPYNPATVFGQYIDSFKDWLQADGLVSRYDTADLSPSEIFEGLAGRLTHLVDAQSRVVDVMGQTTDYDFDFVDDPNAMFIEVNGTTLNAVPTGTHAYGFGPDGNGGYRFTLEYYPDGLDGSTECYVWTMNQPVTVDENVRLTYTVRLTNPKSAPGSYGQYDRDGSHHHPDLRVNNSAVLYPVDSDGTPGDPVSYGLPTVSYTVPGGPGEGATSPSPELAASGSPLAPSPIVLGVVLCAIGIALTAFAKGFRRV